MCVWILDCDPLNVCVCVCVCVKKNSGGHITVKNMPNSLQKEESVSFRFLTGNRKKKLCVQRFCSTAWGTVTRIEPGNDCKKTLPALGADI